MELLLVGDVMLGRLVNRYLLRADPSYPWGDTIDLLRTADWRACNLECVISDRGQAWHPKLKAFHFRSDLKNLAVLRSAAIDAVSLANNHILDFGHDALWDTVAGLDGLGIVHAGAGDNLAAASRMAVSEVAGVRIGLVAFTDNQPEWEATDSAAGVFYCPIDLSDSRAKYLLSRVAQARTAVDLLIVSAHWGPNWDYRPPVEHPRFARALIDHGASIVYGHSGHVVRGIEIYRGCPILYCTGDFVDDYAVDDTERNDYSFVFVLEARAGKIGRIRLYPTIISGFQACHAPHRDAIRIVAKMEELCGAMGTRTVWREEAQTLEIPVS